MKKRARVMDATLVGSVEWEQARKAALDMSRMLSGEVTALSTATEIKDAYSPSAWINVCPQLRVVTDGMIVMRLLAEGKTNAQIARETGIDQGSIAAYKAWNTMYTRDIQRGIERRIKIRSKNDQIMQADIEWLRSIGITVDTPEVEQ